MKKNNREFEKEEGKVIKAELSLQKSVKTDSSACKTAIVIAYFEVHMKIGTFVTCVYVCSYPK